MWVDNLKIYERETSDYLWRESVNTFSSQVNQIIKIEFIILHFPNSIAI